MLYVIYQTRYINRNLKISHKYFRKHSHANAHTHARLLLGLFLVNCNAPLLWKYYPKCCSLYIHLHERWVLGCFSQQQNGCAVYCARVWQGNAYIIIYYCFVASVENICSSFCEFINIYVGVYICETKY